MKYTKNSENHEKPKNPKNDEKTRIFQKMSKNTKNTNTTRAGQMNTCREQIACFCTILDRGLMILCDIDRNSATGYHPEK